MTRPVSRFAAAALFLVAAAVPVIVPRPAGAWAPMDPCRPVWSEQPSRYHVNEDGYSRIPLTTVRGIFTAAMAEWGRPCCSTWSATDAGTTSGVGEDGSDWRNIFSFRETSWPAELGDPASTIAVTLAGWSISPRDGACVDMYADMIFNAANHTFGTSHSFSTVDLRAVATHEAGHWLGLGHSRVSGSTMWPSYTDEGDRTLHSDDTTGVCSLYPGDCSCATDDDCQPGEECVAGACEPSPCDSDGDCPAGLVCDGSTGDCIAPPCLSDDDCPGAQVCDGGECVIDAECPTCLPCSTIDDCGGGEWQCATDGTALGFCTRICTTQTDCPGNSACFGIEGQTFSVCLNDDADVVGICPGGFVCEDPTASDPCDTLECDAGEVCEDGRCVPIGGSDGCVVCDACDDDADCPGGGCWTFDGSTFVCATDCESDADCPETTSCQEFTDGTTTFSLCLNADFESRGPCPDDFSCVAPDPCEGRSCPLGLACDPETGECVSVTGPDVGDPDGGADAADAGDAADVGGIDAPDFGDADDVGSPPDEAGDEALVPVYLYPDEGCACASTQGGGNLVAFSLLALVIVVRRIRR